MDHTIASPSFTIEGLGPLLASATAHASTIMRRWTGGAITLALDSVREIPIEQVAAELGIADQLLTMVVVHMQGDLGGAMVLVFDPQSGRRLADTIAPRRSADDVESSELEKSVLNETGNILACAYVNALSQSIGIPLIPVPPYLLEDYGASALQPLLLEHAVVHDTLFLCEIGFHQGEEALDWRMLLFPPAAMCRGTVEE